MQYSRGAFVHEIFDIDRFFGDLNQPGFSGVLANAWQAFVTVAGQILYRSNRLVGSSAYSDICCLLYRRAST